MTTETKPRFIAGTTTNGYPAVLDSETGKIVEYPRGTDAAHFAGILETLPDRAEDLWDVRDLIPGVKFEEVGA